jgi:hypothetical protein
MSPIPVKPLTVPEAGIDTIEITLEETYDVEGVGKDTVTLQGTLVADRTVPLIGFGEKNVDWKTSAIVAHFTTLNLRGESRVFGAVAVHLDPTTPSQAVAIGGHCRAAIGVIVSMPQHNLTLRTSQPMQLQSDVKTVPPIGDERTQSIAPVALIEQKSGRKLGTLQSAHIVWRELTAQVAHAVQ